MKSMTNIIIVAGIGPAWFTPQGMERTEVPIMAFQTVKIVTIEDCLGVFSRSSKGSSDLEADLEADRVLGEDIAVKVIEALVDSFNFLFLKFLFLRYVLKSGKDVDIKFSLLPV